MTLGGIDAPNENTEMSLENNVTLAPEVAIPKSKDSDKKPDSTSVQIEQIGDDVAPGAKEVVVEIPGNFFLTYQHQGRL